MCVHELIQTVITVLSLIIYFRLPEDIYQTAKVSKLLILMDKGDGHKYKGKSLNEIDINPEVDMVESENSDDDEPANIDTQLAKSHLMSESRSDVLQPSTSGIASSK